MSRARIPVPPLARMERALIVLYFSIREPHLWRQTITMADYPNLPTNSHRNDDGYVLPRSDAPVTPGAAGNTEAADVIRNKLAKLYASEPDALQEEREAETIKTRSPHQQFIYDLNHSGKNLVQIQTEWHDYYMNLPEAEKHKVWQEFYDSSEVARQNHFTMPAHAPTESEKMAHNRNQIGTHSPIAARAREDTRDARTIQQGIRGKVGKKRRLGAKQHAQSLLFGLAVGVVTLLIFLFGFFNEVIIAPFIQPARTAADTPLIVSADTIAPSSEPQVIIPKINVQIPIQFDISSPDEETMQKELESGVAHYPTTAEPGQNGNSAFFGHSSNNIFNKGKYKFAFVLLHQLVPGDTFYITKDGKVYAYKVFSKTVVEPNQVEVLNPVAGHTATATLITCDPPGTSLKRLVVVGDQISPDISGNTAAKPIDADSSAAAEQQLTGNGPTLWGRFIGQFWGKILFVVFILAVFGWAFKISAPRY